MEDIGNQYVPVKTEVILNFDNDSRNKKELFSEIAREIAHSLKQPSLNFNIQQALEEREKVSTTGFGKGLAIPHGKVKDLINPYLFFIRLKHPVEWDSLDGEPVLYVFVILVPEFDEDNHHLKILSQLSYNLMDPEYQRKIKEFHQPEQLKKVIEQMFLNE